MQTGRGRFVFRTAVGTVVGQNDGRHQQEGQTHAHQELEGKSNGKVARDTGEQTCARENQHRTERFDQY